jgi:fructose-1,6-bisphosphatase/inositol monophosphatase family enzyme
MRTDPQEFLAVMAPAVRQAASIARALEGRVQNRPKWGEESAAKAALTLADSAAQEAILVPLRERFPAVGLRAEEDTPSVAGFPADADECVVVDPIDGTLRFYLEGEGPYAVMVGLVRERRYEAALVALPREGLFFQAARGGPARMARPGGEPREVRAEADGRRVLVSPNMSEKVLEFLRGEGLEPAPACGGAIAVSPLLPGVCGGLREAAGVKSLRSLSWQGRIGLLISGAGGARAEGMRGEPFPLEVDAHAPILLVAAREEEGRILRHAAKLLGGAAQS